MRLLHRQRSNEAVQSSAKAGANRGIQNELERDEKRARAGSKASQVVRGGRSGVGVAGLA